MKNQRTVVMDEMGRVVLQREVRNILGVRAGDTLEVAPSQDSISVTLQRDASPGSVQLAIEPLNILTFPKELRDRLGWTNVGCKDIIAVSVNRWSRTFTLRLYEKYEERCVFCDRLEVICEMNRLGVCKHCAGAIAGKFQGGRDSL